MFVWTFIWLVTVAKVHSHWEPCKVQCDDNFKTNDVMQQASLMNVCKRGCDLFTVAFISTSNPFNPLFDRLDHPKALPLLIKQIAVVMKNEKIIVEKEKAIVKNEKAIVKNEKVEMKNEKAIVKNEKMAVITVKGSNERVQLGHIKLQKPQGVIQLPFPFQLPSIIIVDTKTKSSNSATDSSSKTTMEPTSQPVQDHPAEASKETTTTKGPKKLPYKVSQKTINVEENQKDKKKQELSESKKESIMKGRLEQAKHSCRHACVAAYGGAVEQEACVVGCHLQSTTASLNSPEELTNEEPPKSTVGSFQNVIFKLASNVGRLVRVSWSWASSTSQKHEGPQENKIQAYGSNELPGHVQMPLFIGLRQTYNYPHPPKKPETIGLAPNQAMNIMNSGFFHLPRPIIPNEITMNRHQNLPHIITIIKEETKQTSINGDQIFMKEEKFKETEDTLITDKKEQEPKEGQEKDQQQHQLDLLECISRKSGLPRWIIAIAIFASALVVLWLCFSLTAPPDDIKIVKTKPPEGDGLLDYDDEDYDDVLSCSEKKKLLMRNDDVIKIRIENV